jgi:hypothetical protein
MSKPCPDPDGLVARVAVLERRQGVLLSLAGLAALFGLYAFTYRDQEIVRARRVELLDAGGRTRAALATDTAGVDLTLYDTRGHVTGSIRLNGDPRLTVRDESGREVAGLGAPRVQHLTE